MISVKSKRLRCPRRACCLGSASATLGGLTPTAGSDYVRWFDPTVGKWLTEEPDCRRQQPLPLLRERADGWGQPERDGHQQISGFNQSHIHHVRPRNRREFGDWAAGQVTYCDPRRDTHNDGNVRGVQPARQEGCLSKFKELRREQGSASPPSDSGFNKAGQRDCRDESRHC